jgi:hypothetical protein
MNAESKQRTRKDVPIIFTRRGRKPEKEASMTGLSFKSAVFSLVLVCFLGGSAVADTFTFTGNATFGGDFVDFFLSGPSFSISSASPIGPGGVLTTCTGGTLCTMPAQFIPTTASVPLDPGENSRGTVGGVTAYTLGATFGDGGLTFSSFSFAGENNLSGEPVNFTGSGPVTFTGGLKGYDFVPLGCEAQHQFGSCTDLGPQVFDLQLSGSGAGTATGTETSDGMAHIFFFDYTFSGTATTVPEPSSLLLLSSGLVGFAAIRRWQLLRRVNH